MTVKRKLQIEPAFPDCAYPLAAEIKNPKAHTANEILLNPISISYMKENGAFQTTST